MRRAFVRTSEVAKSFGRSSRTIRRWVREGLLKKTPHDLFDVLPRCVPPETILPEWVNTSQLCEIVSSSRATLFRRVREGIIPGPRGGKWPLRAVLAGLRFPSLLDFDPSLDATEKKQVSNADTDFYATSDDRF